ncbi:MAG: A24 family peptidase [Myxococcota bacterium]
MEVWVQEPSSAAWIIALGAVLAGAITDVRTGRIPNWLTFSTLAAGPALHLATSGAVGFGLSVGSILLTSLLPLFLFSKGALGGGDVKLFAAVGGLVFFPEAVGVQLASFVLGATFGLAMALRRGELGLLLARTVSLAHGKTPETTLIQIRFGPAIAVGALLVFLTGLGFDGCSRLGGAW